MLSVLGVDVFVGVFVVVVVIFVVVVAAAVAAVGAVAVGSVLKISLNMEEDLGDEGRRQYVRDVVGSYRIQGASVLDGEGHQA